MFLAGFLVLLGLFPAFGLGLGVQMVPDVLSNMHEDIQTIFSSPITTGGLTALILNLLIPRDGPADIPPVDPA